MSKPNNIQRSTNNRYGENFSLEQLQANAASIKAYYCKDIIRRGLPSIHFDTTFSLTFANTTYSFDMNDLRHLELLQYPVSGQENRTDKSMQHYLGIASKYVYIPCSKEGKPFLLKAQHKLGVMILDAYFRKKLELLDEVNFVLESINSYEFTSENTFDVFYQAIYGNSESSVYRIPLK